jgi:hypothetical protein
MTFRTSVVGLFDLTAKKEVVFALVQNQGVFDIASFASVVTVVILTEFDSHLTGSIHTSVPVSTVDAFPIVCLKASNQRVAVLS